MSPAWISNRGLPFLLKPTRTLIQAFKIHRQATNVSSSNVPGVGFMELRVTVHGGHRSSALSAQRNAGRLWIIGNRLPLMSDGKCNTEDHVRRGMSIRVNRSTHCIPVEIDLKSRNILNSNRGGGVRYKAPRGLSPHMGTLSISSLARWKAGQDSKGSQQVCDC
jgi:hypothetical protein